MFNCWLDIILSFWACEGAARARLGLRLSKCQIVGSHVSRLIYNGKKVSGLDYWLSRELNCEVPQIISRADDWPKVLPLRTLLVRSVQHLVTYTKMFVCMFSFRIRLMTSSLMSTNRVTALEPYIPIITGY